MKIIEQTWEKRNLNVNAVEFVFDKNDTVDFIDEIVLHNNNYNYQLCRIPIGKMDIMFKLQDYGFNFCELSFELNCQLKDYKLSKKYGRVLNTLKYREASKEDNNKVFEAILKGVFDTDRIYLDPYFKKEQSGIRYVNWAKQEIDNNHAKVYIVYDCDNLIGFFIISSIDKNVNYSLLAGLFDKNCLGLGISTIYFPILQTIKENKKKIVTRLSSNNQNSLKTHLALGYTIKEMNYIFVKHISN